MKYRHRRIFLQWSSARFFITWLKRVRFHKHENVSLYKIAKVFLRNLNKDQIFSRANGVAFNFILAIFPAIIFLFTLIPYVTKHLPHVNTETIMKFLGDLMPASMYDVASNTVLDIVSNQRGGLLTFGFLFSLFLSTNGMMALMKAFNACYRTIENRSAIKMRLIATGLTINMAIVLMLAVALLIVGQFLLDYLRIHLTDFSGLNITEFTVHLILVLRFVVILIAFFLAIATIYYFGPAIHYNWSFFSIGSVVATLLCIAVSYGFSFYVTNFATYNKVYGSIGVLIAMMVWVQLITVMLLIGYEVNASFHSAVHLQALWNGRRHRRRKS